MQDPTAELTRAASRLREAYDSRTHENGTEIVLKAVRYSEGGEDQSDTLVSDIEATIADFNNASGLSEKQKEQKKKYVSPSRTLLIASLHLVYAADRLRDYKNHLLCTPNPHERHVRDLVNSVNESLDDYMNGDE